MITYSMITSSFGGKYTMKKTLNRIILYLVIQFETVFVCLLDWVPLLGTLVPLLPLLLKIYVILPHSEVFLRIYEVLE